MLNSKKRHDTEKYKEMFTMAETKEFKAESKRLLEMMINSIYTH